MNAMALSELTRHRIEHQTADYHLWGKRLKLAHTTEDLCTDHARNLLLSRSSLLVTAQTLELLEYAASLLCLLDYKPLWGRGCFRLNDLKYEHPSPILGSVDPVDEMFNMLKNSPPPRSIW